MSTPKSKDLKFNLLEYFEINKFKSTGFLITELELLSVFKFLFGEIRIVTMDYIISS